MKTRLLTILFAVIVTGCTELAQQSTTSSSDDSGPNSVIIQTDLNGNPYRCWALKNTYVLSELNTPGIFWQNSSGNLVHILGNYTRVQIVGNHWEDGYNELGLSKETCQQIHDKKFELKSECHIQLTPTVIQ